MRRTATHDTVLNGHRVAKGEKLTLFYAAANRDERVFLNPDQLDLTRTPNPHVAFGGPGPSFCLGAHLARVEIADILREIFRQSPDLVITG